MHRHKHIRTTAWQPVPQGHVGLHVSKQAASALSQHSSSYRRIVEWLASHHHSSSNHSYYAALHSVCACGCIDCPLLCAVCLCSTPLPMLLVQSCSRPVTLPTQPTCMHTPSKHLPLRRPTRASKQQQGRQSTACRHSFAPNTATSSHRT